MNDTLIFLLLAGLALVLRWLTGLGSKKEEEPDPPEPNESAPRRPPAQSEEERVRRFLEALGAPPGSAPPPPVRTRRIVTPAPRAPRAKVKRSWAQPLPPLVTVPQDTPPPPLTSPFLSEPLVVLEAQPPPEITIPPTLPAAMPLPVSPASARRTVAAAPASLGLMLRSKAAIRQAIILREVLGPPRALQSLDEHRSGI